LGDTPFDALMIHFHLGCWLLWRLLLVALSLAACCFVTCCLLLLLVTLVFVACCFVACYLLSSLATSVLVAISSSPFLKKY
jgi:hypothetical protein